MSPIERSGGGGGSAAGGLVKLFESVLGGASATIDTGANGVAAGHGDLIIIINVRADAGAGGANVAFTFNNDNGANYDLSWIRSSGGVIAPLNSHARGNIVMAQVATADYDANYFGSAQITVAKYSNTTTFKSAVSLSGPTGNAAGQDDIIFASGLWRSTSAINRVAIASGAGNFTANSSMTIYGTQ